MSGFSSAFFYRVALIAVTAGALSACGAYTEDEKKQQSHEMSGFVSEVTLSDGTKCAVFKMGYSGGLDCNWKQP